MIELIIQRLRRWLTILLAAAAWLSLPASAQYEPWSIRPSAQQGGQRGDAAEFRRERGDRNRDASQGRPPERDRGTSSLTPDERRELNRDLQRANREFYRKGREER